MEAWRLNIKSWKVYRPVVADLSSSMIWIRIEVKSYFKVMRIRNPGQLLAFDHPLRKNFTACFKNLNRRFDQSDLFMILSAPG